MGEFVDTQNLIASLEANPRDVSAEEIVKIIAVFRFNESIIRRQTARLARLYDEARAAWVVREAALDLLVEVKNLMLQLPDVCWSTAPFWPRYDDLLNDINAAILKLEGLK